MTPKITPEMREALAQHPDQPLPVEDEVTKKRYLLVDAESARAIAERWIREQLEIGLAAVARGDVLEFDPEAITAAARQRPDI